MIIKGSVLDIRTRQYLDDDGVYRFENLTGQPEEVDTSMFDDWPYWLSESVRNTRFIEARPADMAAFDKAFGEVYEWSRDAEAWLKRGKRDDSVVSMNVPPTCEWPIVVTRTNYLNYLLARGYDTSFLDHVYTYNPETRILRRKGT